MGISFSLNRVFIIFYDVPKKLKRGEMRGVSSIDETIFTLFPTHLKTINGFKKTSRQYMFNVLTNKNGESI
jgi:hypothetical protein